MKKFDFHPGYYHICQLSADKGIIFYSTADILIYYSIIAVKCLQEAIKPLGICIMFNHTHLEAPFRTERQMSSFMNSTGTTFVRGYNSHYGLSGPVFCHNYNRSHKNGEKKIRDTFIYIGNNGKEKIPSINAEDYKYNFINYLISSHPFSEEIDYRTASPHLLVLLAEVLKRRKNLKPLNYAFFGEEYEKLSLTERSQLSDFIISAYYFLDKEKILSIYGSYDNVITAMNAVSGSEHDFKDDFSKENYNHYYSMISICKRLGYDVSKHRLIAPQVEGLLCSTWSKSPQVKPCLPATCGSVSSARKSIGRGQIVLSNLQFAKLVSAIRAQTGASDYEIAKFFHLL